MLIVCQPRIHFPFFWYQHPNFPRGSPCFSTFHPCGFGAASFTSVSLLGLVRTLRRCEPESLAGAEGSSVERCA